MGGGGERMGVWGGMGGGTQSSVEQIGVRENKD